jgi:hypothetical protein
MAHDRNDHRDERPRWRDERSEERFRGGSEDRGFFERAGDEIASWFGDEDAEMRRREDSGFQGRDRDWSRDERPRFYGRDRFEREPDRGFSRPADSQPLAASGHARGGFGREDFERERGRSWRPSEMRGREGFRPSNGREFDPHYHDWRRRQIDDLDRDYEEYRRENQARFEDDFSSWRERRMAKRQTLGQIREHMEVLGSDDEHVGTVDCIAGDRIILARSDPESGGVHHSLSCADLSRVEGDKVILDCTGEQAKQRWRDESRGRALFERQDQGEIGDRILDRSFEGTYR